MKMSNLDELREKLIELDGELWDYQLDRLVPFISHHLEQAELQARIDVVESANCILQADEPAIDEIWFDYNGMPMRQDTMLDELQAQLTNNKSKEK